MRAEKLLKAAALAAVGVALAGQQAQAVPSLLLSTDAVVDPNAPGPNTVVITDGALNDMIGDAGIIGYFGTLGNFTINMTTGLTKPAIGDEDAPLMDIISFNSTSNSNSGGTLTVMFTDTGFTSTDPLTYMSSIGGTTSGELTYQTYRDESNTAFGMSSLLADMGPLMGSPFAFSADQRTKIASVMDPFSLTMVITIDHAHENMNTSFDAELRGSNPEPVTAALSVMGMAGLLSSVRRRRA